MLFRSLGLYPRMSLRGGRPELQRGEHMEIAVRRDWGNGNSAEAAVYRDTFSNTAVTTMLPGGLYADGDVLPDLFSQTAAFNAGGYQTNGYRVSYHRKLSESLQAGVGYVHSGILAAERDSLATTDPNELRSILKENTAHAVTAQLSAKAPRTKTWLASAYQWRSRNAVTASDVFNTTADRALPGLNVTVRQPLPQATYLPGKFEAMAEFRNMLAEGYVPIQTADGRRLFLIPSARSFRGGVNFIF